MAAATPRLTFTGTAANINAALNGLSYQPTTSYFGVDTLQITSDDLGNTGSGAPGAPVRRWGCTSAAWS